MWGTFPSCEWNGCKGQLISKCLFGVLVFFQKMNKSKSTSSKIEFVHSFFERNVGLKESFRICLTFRPNKWPYIKVCLLYMYQRIVNNIFNFLTASVGSMYLLSLSEKVEYLFENYPMCECLHLMENGCSVVAEQA